MHKDMRHGGGNSDDAVLPSAGRLEMMGSGGRWGTVCGRSFTNELATIACRELGFTYGFAMGDEARTAFMEGAQLLPAATADMPVYQAQPACTDATLPAGGSEQKQRCVLLGMTPEEAEGEGCGAGHNGDAFISCGGVTKVALLQTQQAAGATVKEGPEARRELFFSTTGTIPEAPAGNAFNGLSGANSNGQQNGGSGVMNAISKQGGPKRRLRRYYN